MPNPTTTSQQNLAQIDRRVREARDAAELLSALTQALWHRAHGMDRPCPADCIPTLETLSDWLLDGCPESVRQETARSVDALVTAVGAQLPRQPIANAMEQNQAWWALPRRPRHPLASIVHAWLNRPRPAEPFRPRKRASLARIHAVGEEARRLPGFPDESQAPPKQFPFPDMGPTVNGCPSWLLWMYDRAGGQSMAQGRGAPWDLRLAIGAMLHLAVADRNGHWRTLRFPVHEVVTWLHPDGWTNRRRDWKRFPAALDRMRQNLAYLYIRGVGDVAWLFPSVIPRTPDAPFVEFTIRIPRGAASGSRLDWGRLCRYGTRSAGLYRAYLSAVALMDRSAHKGMAVTHEIHAPLFLSDGRPKRRKGGALVRSTTELTVNPTARYVRSLDEKDLARMIGFDPENRKYRQRAREAFEQLHADGVIDLRKDDGGWRIFGPAGDVLSTG